MTRAKLLITDGQIEMVYCETCTAVVSGAVAQRMLAELVRREIRRFGAAPDSIQVLGVESGGPFDIMGVVPHHVDHLAERWPFLVTFVGKHGDEPI